MIKHIFLIFTILYTINGEVTVLNKDNFDKHLEESEYLLVKFYAPWCGHCKKLAPHYDKLSEEGVESVTVAKVDATVETELAAKYEVKGYPTLKWFINGTEYDFKGGRDFDTMNAFLKKATGEWADFIETQEQLDSLLEFSDEDAVVVSNHDTSYLRPLAAQLGAVAFGQLVEDGKSLLPENTLRVYNKFEGSLDYYDFVEDKDGPTNVNFIRRHSIPLINKLKSTSIKRAFEYSRQHFIVVTDDKNYDKVVDQMRPVADLHSPHIIFVTVESTNKQVVDMFGIKEFPTAVLVNLSPKIVKYPMEGEITSENLRNHVTAYQAGELTASLKSEEPPESQEEGKPHVIVGKTFKETVKSNENVFVKFYAPWCGHCKKLAPVWDELAEKLQDENVVIAKYDATANENEDLNIKGFPTLKYYKNGNAIDYSGGRDLDSLVKFVGEHATLSAGHTEL